MTPCSLYSNWKPVTIEEMKGFIAVLLNMGIIQLPNMKDYWSTSDTTNIPFFRSVFSRNRFFQIYGTLHVGKIDGTLRKDKLQPLLDLLCPAFEASYTPSQHLAIDKSIIAFKGRLGCIQYVKGKPHPWGIKAYVLADSVSGYLHKFCIYLGRETELVQPELLHTVRVVLTLVEGLENKGHDLYIDRFYNSPFLATELQKMGITVTGTYILVFSITLYLFFLIMVGTVQANRAGLPPALKAKGKKPKGTVEAFRSGDMMALAWTDKRKVLMLSTKHAMANVQVKSR